MKILLQKNYLWKIPDLLRYLLFLFLFLPTKSKSQDGVFSQYYASSLYLNPALAGMQPNVSLNTNYRLQWLSISPYTLQQVSLLCPFTNNLKTIPQHWGGAGISFYQEKSGIAGSYTTKGIHLSIAYKLPLSADRNHFISFGLQGGLNQQQLETGNYEWGSKYVSGNNELDALSQVDPNTINRKRISADINTGLLWYYNASEDVTMKKASYFIGISTFHINQPNHSLIQNKILQVPVLLKFHAGSKIHITTRISVFPNFIYAYQNKNRQLNVGGYLGYLLNNFSDGNSKGPELIGGIFYRNRDAVIFMTGFNTKLFTVGFSYDMNTSSLKKYTGGKGAYEISLSLKFSKTFQVSRYETPRI